MVRVAKHPDVRREELLDAGLELFRTVGYDGVAIEQITQAAGVAKGTFYNYFAGKQDLLVQLVARFGNEVFATLTTALPQLEGNAVQRFQQLMASAAAFKLAHADTALASVPLLYKPENLEVRHRLFDEWHAQCRPLFRPIIEQGHADGTFDVADPEATTEVVLSLWLDASTRMFDRAFATETEDEFVETLHRGQAALMHATERVLGAAPGSFALPDYAPQYRLMREPFLAALESPAPTPRSTR